MLTGLPKVLFILKLLNIPKGEFFTGIIVFLIVLLIRVTVALASLTFVSVNKRAKEGVFNKSMIIIS